jgi:hypothetical protein
MSPSLIAACVWVLMATATAMLPYRRQFPPGVALLFTAPALLIWIAWDHGMWAGLAGLAGFLSMFRRPLLHVARRALGRAAPDGGRP